MDTHKSGGLAENVVPVVRLFGEDSDVFEGGQAEAEGDVEVAGGVGLGVRLAVVGDLPLVLHLLETVPGAAVLLADFAETRPWDEVDVGAASPFAIAQGRLPESLGFGTAQYILAVAFEFFAVSAVKEFVVFPHRF